MQVTARGWKLFNNENFKKREQCQNIAWNCDGFQTGGITCCNGSILCTLLNPLLATQVFRSHEVGLKTMMRILKFGCFLFVI